MVHRIAELIQTADAIHENEEVRKKVSRGGFTLVIADGRAVNINSVDEIAVAVGRFICGDVGRKHLNPEHRPQVLHQVAEALKRKSRKSGKADDIAKIRAAWREAKAEQKGLHKGDDPTYREVAQKYYKKTGSPLDRRALNKAGCLVRPDKRGKKRSYRSL